MTGRPGAKIIRAKCTPLEYRFTVVGPTALFPPEPCADHMAQFILYTFLECGVSPGQPKIVEIDISVLELMQRMNRIGSPERGAMLGRSIHNASTVSYR